MGPLDHPQPCLLLHTFHRWDCVHTRQEPGQGPLSSSHLSRALQMFHWLLTLSRPKTAPIFPSRQLLLFCPPCFSEVHQHPVGLVLPTPLCATDRHSSSPQQHLLLVPLLLATALIPDLSTPHQGCHSNLPPQAPHLALHLCNAAKLTVMEFLSSSPSLSELNPNSLVRHQAKIFMI